MGGASVVLATSMEMPGEVCAVTLAPVVTFEKTGFDFESLDFFA